MQDGSHGRFGTEVVPGLRALPQTSFAGLAAPAPTSLSGVGRGFQDPDGSERLLLNHDARILGPQRRRIQSGARDEA